MTPLLKPRDLKMASDGSGEQIFFLYDHNCLQSEEDDIKDAIRYFHPTSVLEDVQWALCGQLMGIVEFLMRFKASDSATKVFCLRYNKFAVRTIGQYSMVLGGHFSDPDSILQEQLDFMHRLFEFYHRSLADVLQTTNTESHGLVLQGICDSFLALIRYYGDSLSTAFNAVPWLNLQKGSTDVQLHASYLLQCCQKTEGVLSGCLFFKNKLLYSQLQMSVVLPLLIIRTHQNNLPCQSISSESDLHEGVRLVKVFLRGSQLKLLLSTNSPLKVSSVSAKSAKESRKPTVTVASESMVPVISSHEIQKTVDSHGNRNERDTLDFGVSPEDSENTEQEAFDSKSEELALSDLIDSSKTLSIADKSEKSAEVPKVKLQHSEEKNGSAKLNDALSLSELSASVKNDENCRGDVRGIENAAKSRENKDVVKKKKTILKSKPKSAKALPKASDIFKAVKLKLKETKPEEKYKCLMQNVNHSSSEELFAPRPLSLIDLNTDESPTNSSANSPKTIKSGFNFLSPKTRDSNLNKSQDGLRGKIGSKVSGKNNIMSPKSASMSEISGKTLNIAERLKLSGSSSFSSSLSAVKAKSDSDWFDKFQTNDEVSYLSDTTKSVLAQKTAKESSQKRNVSFQEFPDIDSIAEACSLNMNDGKKMSDDPTSEKSDKDTELHEFDLYIQTHSDILLMLFMEKGASQSSQNLKELWMNALPQLGNLDALVKQCSEITELSRDQNYFYLMYNKVQKQLSGNMLWPITAPQSEFSDSVVNIHDQFRRNPDIHDITWRSYSYSTYGHQGSLRETFYQNQMPHPPTFSPLVERDGRLCLDTKAQNQLGEDHNITFL